MTPRRREFLKAMAAGAMLPYGAFTRSPALLQSNAPDEIDRLFDETIVIDTLSSARSQRSETSYQLSDQASLTLYVFTGH